MTTTTPRGRKAGGGKRGKRQAGLALPDSTTTVEIGGTTYFVTPTHDMQEWLEEVEDILDSRKALEEPGDSVPFEKAVKDMGLKLPARQRQ